MRRRRKTKVRRDEERRRGNEKKGEEGRGKYQWIKVIILGIFVKEPPSVLFILPVVIYEQEFSTRAMTGEASERRARARGEDGEREERAYLVLYGTCLDEGQCQGTASSVAKHCSSEAGGTCIELPGPSC